MSAYDRSGDTVTVDLCCFDAIRVDSDLQKIAVCHDTLDPFIPSSLQRNLDTWTFVDFGKHLRDECRETLGQE